jgi:hypothetical protein
LALASIFISQSVCTQAGKRMKKNLNKNHVFHRKNKIRKEKRMKRKEKIIKN